MELYGNGQQQRVLIRILSELSESEIVYIIQEIGARIIVSDCDMAKYLYLCITESDFYRKSPDSIRTFEKVCCRIAESTGNKVEIKKDFVDFLSTKGINAMKINRIEHGEAQLYMQDAKEITGVFDDEITAFFWLNELHLSCSSMSLIYKEPIDIGKCLRFIFSLIPNWKLEQIRNILPDYDILIFDYYVGTNAEQLSTFGDPPYHLYEIISSQLRRLRINSIDFAETEIFISTNTWFAWQKKWIDAEKSGFQKNVPKTRLFRWHILYMIVRFDFSISEANVFMAMAGYFFHNTETDIMVTQYLSNRVANKQAVLNSIRNKYLKAPKYTNEI